MSICPYVYREMWFSLLLFKLNCRFFGKERSVYNYLVRQSVGQAPKKHLYTLRCRGFVIFYYVLLSFSFSPPLLWQLNIYSITHFVRLTFITFCILLLMDVVILVFKILKYFILFISDPFTTFSNAFTLQLSILSPVDWKKMVENNGNFKFGNNQSNFNKNIQSFLANQ